MTTMNISLNMSRKTAQEIAPALHRAWNKVRHEIGEIPESDTAALEAMYEMIRDAIREKQINA
jgi:hypothetical protein